MSVTSKTLKHQPVTCIEELNDKYFALEQHAKKLGLHILAKTIRHHWKFHQDMYAEELCNARNKT